MIVEKLYLHIGTPKTGTTALQWFFFRNRDLLKERGITYPEIGLVGHCHHRIGASFYPPEYRPYYIQYKDTLKLEQYAKQILAIEGDVLISTELLAHGFFAPRLRSVIGDSRVRIILYLRRQDEYLVSRYNQDIKAMYPGTLQEYYTENEKYLDYRAAIIEGWASEWGMENIVVRPYEKEQFANGRIFDDFCRRVFGWDVPANFRLPAKPANPRLSRDAIEYKRAVNNLPLTDKIKCDLAETMQRYSSASDPSNSEAFVMENSLPAPIKKRILEAYNTSNAWIARSFLGRADGRLFAVPAFVPDTSKVYYGGLTASRLSEISRFVAEDSPQLSSSVRAAAAEATQSDDKRVRESGALLGAAMDPGARCFSRCWAECKQRARASLWRLLGAFHGGSRA